MKRTLYILVALLCVTQLFAVERIDRRAVVARHRIITGKLDKTSPAQVGNGEFAFAVDVTGLQTFVPFNTMSHWSWHSFPLPAGSNPSDCKPQIIDVHGKKVPYNIGDPAHPEMTAWLARNPHRFNLGRVGLKLVKSDGSIASEEDMKSPHQEVDLWSGIIYSSFIFEGDSVKVTTSCHPTLDAIGVSVESPALKSGKVSVFIDFPYPTNSYFQVYAGRYDMPQAHSSKIVYQQNDAAYIAREMDSVRYYTAIHWTTPAHFVAATEKTPHHFELQPTGSDKLSFTCLFSEKENRNLPDVAEIINKSTAAWESFWMSGAAIDLSGSSDPRWRELEKRIVLSQYVLRVNEAGSLPPQESGLLNNGWYGRFHFEMIWWHTMHAAFWNRWEEIDKSLSVYKKYLPTSTQRAKEQGYKGARWPKCTGNLDREWPCDVHGVLIWQQPHPIYFAEMDYRLHPTQATLDKWKDIVFATADFMADYPYYDKSKKQYVLGPPLIPVSENVRMMVTYNPIFELGYWRFGLRVAQQWRERLSLPVEKKWKDVENNLSPLPVQDSVYVTYEGIPDMWTKYNYEHPGLIGIYGLLPGDGVDKATFSRTLDKVARIWDFDRTWGWDFPMLAMAAARMGQPTLAMNFLLHPGKGFFFDDHGLATGGPFPYFPSNGALLTAVAMMAGGWDGSAGENPGFPKDGTWNVKAEGFSPMP